jgi:hypothetical protein
MGLFTLNGEAQYGQPGRSRSSAERPGLVCQSDARKITEVYQMKNGFTAVLTRMRPRTGISIAEIFGAGVFFIKKTFWSHRDGEGSSRRHGDGAAPPLDEEQLAVLQATLEICPEAAIDELQRLIADECKVTVSRRSIRHALKKLREEE